MFSCSLPALPRGKHRKMKRHKTRYNVSVGDLNIRQRALLHGPCNLELMILICELFAFCLHRFVILPSRALCSLSILDVYRRPYGPVHFLDCRASSGQNISSFSGPFGPPRYMLAHQISNNADTIVYKLRIFSDERVNAYYCKTVEPQWSHRLTTVSKLTHPAQKQPYI